MGWVLLVRHAEAEIPRVGGPDEYHRPLSARGSAQAQRLLGLPRPDAVFSSPYLRAVQTVQPLADAFGLAVRTDHELREWDSGLAPKPDYARYYAESWAEPGFARPGGESLARLTERAVAVLTRLAGEFERVVVGSHGTFVARALVGFGVVGVDWELSRSMPMPAIYRVDFGGDRVTVAEVEFEAVEEAE